jgi:uncharacterized membrane protein
MLNVEFNLNLLSLIVLIFGALFTGYQLRGRQLKKKQHKISDLRKEIVYNHAEILELQMEYVALEKSIKTTKATVLPMNAVQLEAKESAAL